ncbi:MAG: hypothetical protein U9Q07_05705, partial [Planctomycetota bacterium]|nr:hypothetical protein [Planctomycetota bacterium]
YIEARHLWEDAKVTPGGIRIADMHYLALILEEEPPSKAEPTLKMLENAGRIIRWRKEMSDSDLIGQIDRLVPLDVRVSPETPDLRVRHVVKHGIDCYLLFNEGQDGIDVHLNVSAEGRWFLFDAQTGKRRTLNRKNTLNLARHEMKILGVG